MSSPLSNLTTARIHPEPYADQVVLRCTDNSCDDVLVLDAGDDVPLNDDFDRLPDSILLLVFNRIGDIKSLGRCSTVSRRFYSLVSQVDNVVIRVDCVISDDDDPSSASSSTYNKSRSAFLALFRSVFANFFKRFQSLSQILGTKRSLLVPGFTPSFSFLSVGFGGDLDPDLHGGVHHHSPTQVLRNFHDLRFLKIQLPNGELGIDDGVLLKWRADFGSTLDSCVILGASSISFHEAGAANPAGGGGDNSGSIPESFYTNGGLKLRVVWTISSLIAAAGRHFLLQPIIAEHRTLDRVLLTDVDGQGVLCMNKEQLEELRVKPLSPSCASRRTQVPALNLRLWYATHLELPGGVFLKGATLVAIRPSEQSGVASKKESSDLSWVSSAFEEPYGTAAKLLVKGRTYSLEMNSF
ncbi:hypothetical protein Dimus_030986 [Dionaea muscipula]